MKKSLLTAIAVSVLLFSLLVSFNSARADITDFTKGPYIMSPTNATYSSGFLALNVSFHGAIFGNDNYSMTYSIDGNENETLPLNLHYFGFFLQNESYIDGLVNLPELSDASHNITVYLKLEMHVDVNGQTHNKTYFDSQTIFFSIKGTTSFSSTPAVPEFSWLTILPLLLSIPIVLITIRNRLQRNV